MPKRRTGTSLHNQMIFFRATALEKANLKAAAKARGTTMTDIVMQAIYKFLGWK